MSLRYCRQVAATPGLDGMKGFELESWRKSDGELKAIKNKKLDRLEPMQTLRGIERVCRGVPNTCNASPELREYLNSDPEENEEDQNMTPASWLLREVFGFATQVTCLDLLVLYGIELTPTTNDGAATLSHLRAVIRKYGQKEASFRDVELRSPWGNDQPMQLDFSYIEFAPGQSYRDVLKFENNVTLGSVFDKVIELVTRTREQHMSVQAAPPPVPGFRLPFMLIGTPAQLARRAGLA